MNLPTLKELISLYQLDIRGVIHIGAHVGQEYDEYVACGIKNMMFFEPLKNSYSKLIKKLPEDDRIRAYNIALGNETGTRVMFVETCNQGMSSSLLEPKHHLKQYPHITFNNREEVTIDKLDNIDFDHSLFNMINIDVQGFELEVFRGGTITLDSIEVIRTEVNIAEMYKGCVLLAELDLFLAGHGFRRMLIDNGPKYWGEAIYLKEKNDNR